MLTRALHTVVFVSLKGESGGRSPSRDYTAQAKVCFVGQLFVPSKAVRPLS